VTHVFTLPSQGSLNQSINSSGAFRRVPRVSFQQPRECTLNRRNVSLKLAGFQMAILVPLSPEIEIMACAFIRSSKWAGARFEGVAHRLGCLGQLEKEDVLRAPYSHDLSNLNRRLCEAHNWLSKSQV